MTADKIYTMNEVVASLSMLSGQMIKVRGVLRVGRENHSISDVAEPDFRVHEHPRLWVYFHHATLGTRERDLPKFDRRQVIAEGVPDISRKRHFGGFAGSLTIRHMEFCES